MTDAPNIDVSDEKTIRRLCLNSVLLIISGQNSCGFGNHPIY